MSLSISTRTSTGRRLHWPFPTALILGLAVTAHVASAGVSWHPDLPAALDAARASGKPVLAIFEANWNQTDNADLFANPEVAAVVSACFEPVRIDVYAESELTRDLDVKHVPEACVLDAGRRPLARFDCPAHASEFIAAAARAAQVAAATAAIQSPLVVSDGTEETIVPREALKGSATATASALAHKVKNLVGFAETGPPVERQPSRFRPIPPAATFDTAGIEADSAQTTAATNLENVASTTGATDLQDSAITTAATNLDESAAYNPSLTQMPAKWPAEPAPTSVFTPLDPTANQSVPPRSAAFSSKPPADPAGMTPPLQPATRDIEPAGTATAGWIAGEQAPSAGATAPAATIVAAAQAEMAAELQVTAATQEAAPTYATSSMMGFFLKPWSVFSRSSREPTVEPPAPPPTLPPAQSITPAAVAASAPPQTPDPHGSMPLGLEGYCPVTLADRGTWVEGRAKWGVRHRGRTYLFAGPEQQQTFLASADRYAPALSGDDPVIAMESGRSEPGRRSYGVTYQSRMYLFASPETRAAFSADPGRYTARVMIAEGVAPAEAARRF